MISQIKKLLENNAEAEEHPNGSASGSGQGPASGTWALRAPKVLRARPAAEDLRNILQ